MKLSTVVIILVLNCSKINGEIITFPADTVETLVIFAFTENSNENVNLYVKYFSFLASLKDVDREYTDNVRFHLFFGNYDATDIMNLADPAILGYSWIDIENITAQAYIPEYSITTQCNQTFLCTIIQNFTSLSRSTSTKLNLVIISDICPHSSIFEEFFKNDKERFFTTSFLVSSGNEKKCSIDSATLNYQMVPPPDFNFTNNNDRISLLNRTIFRDSTKAENYLLMIVKKENYNTSLKFIADYYNETTDCDIAIPTKDKRDAIYFITLVVKDYNRNTREITTAFSDYDLRNENLSTEKYLERKFSGIFDNARTITSFDIVNSLSTHYNDPQQVAIFTDDFNYLKGFDSGSLNRENRKINYILYLTSENQTLVENLEKTFYRDKIDKFIHSTFYIMTPNKRENASSENVCNQIKEPPPPLLIWWYWALIFIGCFVVAIGIGILYQIFKKNPVSALLETYQMENKEELTNECDKRRLFKNDFQINFNVVKGHGVSSTVYEAKIKRDLIPNLLKKSMENNTPSEYCIVAAKILNNYEDDEIFEVIGEIQAVQKLGNHDKICTLLGWSTHSSAPCLFFEMMEMDLQSYLISLRKPATNASIKRNEMILCATTFGEKFVVPEFDTKQNIIFLQILWQISQGLEYIASKNIVHRDVAARNILLSHYGNNETFIAKITDFGLCILLDKNTNVYHSTSNKLLPNKWLAIECHLDRMFSQASDVWAFGILMIEIYTCAGNLYPHVGLNELVHYLKNGKRMEKPKNMPQELYDLAFSCWDKNPYSRKSFSKMCLELKMMLREVNSCNSEYVDEWQNSIQKMLKLVCLSPLMKQTIIKH